MIKATLREDCCACLDGIHPVSFKKDDEVFGDTAKFLITRGLAVEVKEPKKETHRPKVTKPASEPKELKG